MKLLICISLILFTKVEYLQASRVPLIEGSACLTIDGGDGYCKNVLNCQWIRDSQIRENYWTTCDATIPLVCCKDLLSTLNDVLDCDTNTANIFSASLLQKCRNGESNVVTVAPTTTSTTEKPEKITDLSYNNIFYTDEECQRLHTEYKRLEDELNRPDGIAHGNKSIPGEFPFMAAIYTRKTDTGAYENDCGGSIITKRHILTAAHCIIYPPDEYQEKALVKYGSILQNEGMKEVRLGKPPVYFPTFTSSGRGNDIAILYLEDDIDINADAMPVCLYHGNRPLSVESNATIIGFGLTHDGNSANHLQKAQINIKNNAECSEDLLPKPGFTGILESQICAGDTTVTADTCRGDSGGPLIQMFAGVKTVVGLTSFGQDSCESNKVPAVYTRVSHFIDWIKEEVQKDFVDVAVQQLNVFQRVKDK